MVFFNYSHSQFLTALIIGLFFPLGFPQMALNSDGEDTLKSFMAFDITSRGLVFRVVVGSQIVVPPTSVIE